MLGHCQSVRFFRFTFSFFFLCAFWLLIQGGGYLSGTLIGMPANLAREAVDKTPKMVLLRARESGWYYFLSFLWSSPQLT